MFMNNKIKERIYDVIIISSLIFLWISAACGCGSDEMIKVNAINSSECEYKCSKNGYNQSARPTTLPG